MQTEHSTTTSGLKVSGLGGAGWGALAPSEADDMPVLLLWCVACAGDEGGVPCCGEAAPGAVSPWNRQTRVHLSVVLSGFVAIALGNQKGIVINASEREKKSAKQVTKKKVEQKKKAKQKEHRNATDRKKWNCFR